MATMLSMKSVGEIPGARLQLGTEKSSAITLTLKDGRILKFQQYGTVLYFFDTNTDVIETKTNKSLHNYSLVQTVNDNKSYSTPQEIKGADTSRKF